MKRMKVLTMVVASMALCTALHVAGTMAGETVSKVLRFHGYNIVIFDLAGASSA